MCVLYQWEIYCGLLCNRNALFTFQSERGLVSMLKKHVKELSETRGNDWLDEGFILGVIMDLTAAGNILKLTTPRQFYKVLQ